MTWRLRELAQPRGGLVWSAEGESESRRDRGPLGYQGNREKPLRIFAATALGPRIEIYRIRP